MDRHRDDMVLAVAQPRSVLGDLAFNAAQHANAIERAGARVVVFPELSLTGYGPDLAPVDLSDRRLDPIGEACRATSSIALVGAPVAGRGGVHIAMVAIDGTGGRPSVVYRKMWLGGDEAGAFVPGREPAVLEVDGYRLGLAICKDMGVPDHASATAALGIDVYVAGVCESEDDRWVSTARARRTTAEHDVWVAVASFAGPTGGGFDATAGRSRIWQPDGTVVAELDRRPGSVAAAKIDPAEGPGA